MPHSDLHAVLERARTLGVLGPGPVDDHIDHAQLFIDALADASGRLLDLGSGGGVPGLVIAVARPDLEVVLLDAQERRVALLREAVEALDIGERTTVLHGRAEEVGHDRLHRHRFEAVTARSFGPPAVVAECAAPLLVVGGCLVVSEPPSRPNRWPTSELAELGLAPRPSTIDGVAVLRQEQLCPGRYPRRIGLPAKRPLF